MKESEILKFWKKNKIYSKVREIAKGRRSFFFLDGPPYATGFIHLGTAWNKILKDCYIRYWRMNGFDVFDRPGYDTHGLPIEKKVEEKLKMTSKKDIEKYGIDKFNKKCKDWATKFVDEMNDEFADVGIWMDWDNPYLTLTNDYIEAAWATFKIAFDKDLLFLGVYPVHICPRCETAVAYNEINYEKIQDPSIYVKFPIKGKKESLLIWTTTPWTLLANTGVMVNPNAEYVKVKIDSETLIIAKDLLETVMKKLGKEYQVVENMRGKDLEGIRYEHPLQDKIPFSKHIEKENGYRVVLSEQYVSMENGSGLVHCAPGHGAEDYKVGSSNGLPIICHVGINGVFDDECEEWAGKRARESNNSIINVLKEKGALLLNEKLVHDYPKCWRCETSLLTISIPQWFFKVTEIRDNLLQQNQKINWFPEWSGLRFKNWLETLGDWPISRQRYWGIPLPIWRCKSCGNIRVIGSAKELGAELKDLHRPYVDEIKLDCGKCGKEMKRIPDVLDVWFDSGLASWAAIGWPKDMDSFYRRWPADLNIEGPDQIRGWWNSQLITSVIAFDKSAFRNVLFHGFVLDAHGIKMAKSKGNIVSPKELSKKYGRDVLRMYLMSSPPWDDFVFNWKDIEALWKQFTVIQNSFNFVETYVTRLSKAELKMEDRWILSKLNSLVERVTQYMKSYNGHKASQEIQTFILNDFSRTYIKLIRDRVWPAYGGDDAAFYTLYEVSKVLSRLLAPFTPFLSENIHQTILRKFGETTESVHLCTWPIADKKIIDPEIEEMMTIALKIAYAGTRLRQKAGVKLRWPLSEIIIDETTKNKAVVRVFKDVIKQLANVKNVMLGTAKFEEVDGIKIWLNTELTPNLKHEASIKELIRAVQETRKKLKMIVGDKISLSIKDFDVKGFEEEIKAEVGATKLSLGKLLGEKGEFEFEGNKIEFAIKKM